jgi:DNA-binding NarL/FixJ family response regulator
MELIDLRASDLGSDTERRHRVQAGAAARRQRAPVLSHARNPMPHQLKAVAFDLDAASLISLREALPEWEIEVVNGATAASLTDDWNPGAVDLLIVKARAEVAETLGLCRFLVCGVISTDSREEVTETLRWHRSRQNQARRADAALLVLVPSGQESLARAALEAGAAGCLVLPVHAKQVASMLARVRQGNRPGRHTLNLDPAQCEDPWRDHGGQG